MGAAAAARDECSAAMRGSPAGTMDVMGDTDGDDACNTTEDDTHLHALVTRSIQVQLKR